RGDLHAVLPPHSYRAQSHHAGRLVPELARAQAALTMTGGSSKLRRAWAAIARSPLRLVPVLAPAGCITLPKPPATQDLASKVLPEGTPPPPQWTAGGAGAGSVEGGWLATFADADLDALVTEALDHNADLQAAAARVEQAAGYVRAAGGQMYPSVDLLARGG